MSKYVLYDGKAYEAITESVSRRPAIRTDRGDYLYLDNLGCPAVEITEAEYHARKLLECEIDIGIQKHVGQMVENYEAERQPKHEVTERHIGCLVEYLWSDISPTLDVFDKSNIGDDSIRLPRQPVPLALHKHDGGGCPSFVSYYDFVVFKTIGNPEFGGCAASYMADVWKNVEAFAVIKPILPEGI